LCYRLFKVGLRLQIMSNSIIIETALKTIRLELESIELMKNYINADFEKAVTTIAASKGRLIISGIGKSAIIAQKIVATLNSTGTPSVFMHGADAIHGDLGIIQKEDVVLIISKSGESPEIKVLIPLIKNFGNVLVGMTGNEHSFLAGQCDIFINTTILQEACPNNLAPTTSTTVQVVMGDALAVCLMQVKGFNTGDFARYHPGGALGKKLYLRVRDLSLQNEKPSVMENATISEVIVEISKKRLGATVVLNSSQLIAGIITDGDLRRMLSTNTSFESLSAKDIMTINPKTIDIDTLAVNALEMMRQKNISQLIVTQNNQFAGFIHLHDLVREGII
jgi:arabinose-5-phosphate isomerase